MRLGDQVLHVGGRAVALDVAGEGGQLCFVSHAHSDHTAALKRGANIIASDATLEIAHAVGAARVHSVDGLVYELLPAGHMLGSRQLRIEGDGGVFTYTGDMKMGPSLTAEEVIIKETDELLIDATFGDPSISFPERSELYDAIAKWVSGKYNEGKIVLLGAYSVGKAQELVALLNRYCSITPIVSERAERACAAYEKFGVRLERACVGSEAAEELMRGGFVAILPIRKVDRELSVRVSRFYGREAVCAVATGWAARMRFPTDAAFPLSDHADFRGILEYIELSWAKRVVTFGDGKALSSELRKRGYDARALGEEQARLGAW